MSEGARRAVRLDIAVGCFELAATGQDQEADRRAWPAALWGGYQETGWAGIQEGGRSVSWEVDVVYWEVEREKGRVG